MRIAHRCSSESELTYEHDEFTPSPGSEENPDKFLCTMMKVNNFIFLPLFLFNEKKNDIHFSVIYNHSKIFRMVEFI